MLERALTRSSRALDWLFGGEVTPWIYAWLRIGLASVLLVRSTDLLAPLVFLEHHLWVKGLDFGWSVVSPTHLVSPLVPGLVLGETSTLVLVVLRTLLAVLMLVGVYPRAAALSLALVSYALMASDRFRYFHHLHFLYLAIAWSALGPLGDRLSLERSLRRDTPAPSSSPVWPLQLMRAFVIGIYFAAGLAKLEPAFFSGRTLEELDQVGMLRGPVWESLHAGMGFGGVAKLTCLTELALALLLIFRQTRRLAVGGGVLFHALISASMMVSTFGVQMVILLFSFLPDSRMRESSTAPAVARL